MGKNCFSGGLLQNCLTSIQTQCNCDLGFDVSKSGCLCCESAHNLIVKFPFPTPRLRAVLFTPRGASGATGVEVSGN